MNIYEALTDIARYTGLNADELIAYAAEDTVGGYHSDPALSKWSVGSQWAVEGQVLYALTRAMRPTTVLEIGTHYGCSATHVLTALEANGKGKLLSLDLLEGAGEGIPEHLRQRWQFVATEAASYLTEHPMTADIVYEDALHDPIGTRAILTAVRDHVSARIILSHDAEHSIVGADVRAAWRDVFGQFSTALIDPADCGLAWRVTR